MDFYSKLKELGLEALLENARYETPEFYNWRIVSDFLDDIVSSVGTEHPKRVFVYGDYDVDGAMSAKIIAEGLKYAGVSDIDIYRYTQYTHLLDPIAVNECIIGRYDYFIICDTSSADLEPLYRILNLGTRVMVLDHHVTEYSYDDFGDSIAIINTELENSLMEDGQEPFCLSAGALCYVVLRKFFEEHDMMFDNSISAYAVISLFADCMNMTNKRNRSIYYEAKKLLREELPQLVLLFMNQYSTFSARYIGFWFAPRINALFRSENFQLLNELLFSDLNGEQLQRCMECIEQIYLEKRQMVKEVAEIVDVDELEHFVVADLYSADKYYSIEDNKLYNYTGLVANIISERYGKTAVTYCYAKSYIKGSVRDLFGRNYLILFQQICYAAGHQAAFGLKIRPFDFDDFIINLRHIDRCFSINEIMNEPLIVDFPYQEPDLALIEDMALYNEFSGQGVPIAYLRKQIIGSLKAVKTKYNYKYKWGDYCIRSDRQLNFGSFVLIKPIKSIQTKLLAQ